MTGSSSAKARTVSGLFAAALLLAAASPSFAGVMVSAAQDRPVVGLNPALRCQAGVNQCLHTCRVDNKRASRQCENQHAALQPGSCKPNPKDCTCWATAPTCTPLH